MHESNGSITIHPEGVFIPKAVFGHNEQIVAALRQAGALGLAPQTSEPAVRKVTAVDRTQELRWLRDHSVEFAGQWVALQGDHLLTNGSDAKAVFAAAKASGAASPFFAHLPSANALPFGGW